MAPRPALLALKALMAFALPLEGESFVLHNRVHALSSAGAAFRTKPVCVGDSVDEVSLDVLGDDHVAEGDKLARSVAGWLDTEWMIQEVHERMGRSAAASYVSCRESGDDEIMSILHRVATDLESDWRSYDKDAFVNAWDVGNYVADYLTQRAGGESCGCSAQIYDPDASR